MRTWFSLLSILCIIGCTEEEPLEETGSIFEYKVDEDSLTIANGGVIERDLSEEPEIIRDFFSLPSELLSDEFCYDREALLKVVVDGIEDEYGWHKYVIQENANYFATDNYECYSEISFKTFTQNGVKKAFLNRMDKNWQEFTYLEKISGEWVEQAELPFVPTYADFFEGLSYEEAELVNEYGYYSMYLSNWGDTVEYIFSEWEMGLKMGEKEVDEFNKEADYSFKLFLKDGEFATERDYLKQELDTLSDFNLY